MKNIFFDLNSKIKTIAFLISLILFGILISFLHINSQKFDYSNHKKVIDTHAKLLQTDTLIKESIIETRFGLQKNYDQINYYTLQLSDFLGHYLNTLSEVGYDDNETKQAYLDLRLKVDERQVYIDKFQSQFSMHNSSIDSFLLVIEQFKTQLYLSNNQKDHFLVDKINELLLALYQEFPREKFSSELIKIEELHHLVPNNLLKNYKDILSYGNNVVKSSNNINSYMDSLLQIDTMAYIKKLADQYERHYTKQKNSSQLYQNIIIFLMIIMLIVIIFIFYQLAKTSANLKKTLHSLKFQQYAMDQHAIISIADAEGNITYINEMFCQISGFTKQELLGKNHRIIKSDEHDKAFYENMWETITHGNVWHGEIKNLSKTGETYWVSSTIVPFLNEENEPYQYVSIRTNISKRKQTEIQLIEDRMFFAHITEAMAEGLYTQDKDGKCTYVNPEVERILGWSSEELLGKNLHDIIHYQDCHGTSIPANQCKIFGSYLDKQAYRTDKEVFWRKDGTMVPVYLSAVPVYDNGKLKGGVVAFQDITLRQRQDKLLAEALLKAEENSTAKSLFLANMSHEIRTPMNAIIGMTYLTLQTELNDKQKNYITKVNNSAESLLALLNDILDFSKIEAKKLDLEENTFVLNDVLQNVIDILAIPTNKQNLELLLDIDQNIPPTLIGDSLRLQQALLNLANNAIKFTDSGEVIISVKVKQISAQQVTLKFSVKDSGIGMTPKQKKALFVPFTQADTSTTKKYGGTGLGLAITSSLIALMKGTINVESELGEGSTFSFTLDFAISDKSLASISSKQAPIIPNCRVLVLDDNKSSREILLQQLSMLNFQAEALSNGQDALSCLQENNQHKETSFDIAIVDWKMANMNGIEFLHQLTKLNLPNLPLIVMMTGFAEDALELALEKDKLSIDAFLSKPFGPSSLQTTLYNIIQTDKFDGERIKNKSHNKQTQNTLQNTHVLVVEDNELNQELAIQLLNINSITADLAVNGEEALKYLAQNNHYDCVLMDCQMPVMDGYTATKIIREKYGKSLPIIATTANVMKADKEKAIAAGMDDFIQKPINVKYMMEVLSRWVKPSTSASQEVQSDAQPEAQSDANSELQPKLKPSEKIKANHLDSEKAIKMLDGNSDLYLQLIKRFKESFKNSTKELHQLIDEDLETATRLAHTIKGTAATIATTSLHQIAAQIEQDLNNGLLADSKSHLDALQTALEGVFSDIDILLAESHDIASNTSPLSDNQKNEIIQTLREHLESFDAKAESTFALLRDSVKNEDEILAMDSLSKAINQYDFEKALIELNLLFKEQEYENE